MWAWSCRRTWLENDGMIPEDSYPARWGKIGDIPQMILQWTEEDIVAESCRRSPGCSTRKGGAGCTAASCPERHAATAMRGSMAGTVARRPAAAHRWRRPGLRRSDSVRVRGRKGGDVLTSRRKWWLCRLTEVVGFLHMFSYLSGEWFPGWVALILVVVTAGLLMPLLFEYEGWRRG